MILDYQLHKEIEEMLHERAMYEEEQEQGNQLRKVKENLNNRIITLKEQLLEQPENQNLNLELSFCQTEEERINQELQEYQQKHETKTEQIKKHETIIDYNIQELKQYTKYLEELNTDKILIKAMKNTIETLENNINQLNYIKE